MAQKTPETLYLVDASGFIFRAFYALPPLTNPQGVPVGAVLGFANMLLRLLTELEARHVGVIFDAGRKNFRNDIYPAYKANRDETPPELVPQFPLIREATRAFGFEPLEASGYEADDLIAAYATKGRAEGQEVVIVSSDKDLMQLVGEGVRMYDPLKQRYIGPDEVVGKFGVRPDKVVDVQALCGDATDNVPGVPGIGIKTAAELINAYGSLEDLLAEAHTIKQPKRRERLMEHAELARISQKLVRLDTSAPLPRGLDALNVPSTERAELADFLQTQGFKSVLARLGATPSKGTAPAPTPSACAPMQEGRYITIDTLDTLKSWVEGARTAGIVAVDTETTSITPAKADLVGISLCYEAGVAAYIPVGHSMRAHDLLSNEAPAPNQLKLDEVLGALKELLEDEATLKVGQNIKYDLQMFAAHDINVSPVDDTMLLSYVLDGTTHGHGMDELAKLHLGHTCIAYSDVTGKGAKQIGFDEVSIEAATPYAAEDADVTLRLHQLLKPRLAPEGMATVYESMERPITHVIADMERAGIKVDGALLHSLSNIFGTQLAALEGQIHALAGHPFNVASPKQMGEVLFGELGLPSGKKTKTGDWSTAAGVLEQLAAEGHEIVEKILEWRQLSKLKSTYTDALQAQINPRTGRVHTAFGLAHTTTGRLASSEPNLQNIPIRTEEGRKIRAAFIAKEGYSLISADYSQIELRLAAAIGNIPALKTAFIDGQDIHAHTASEVFGVPMDEMTPELRRRAKAINFGIIYGISPWGLAKQLGIEPAEASSYIKQYFARFPELADFMERSKDEARRHGYITTFYGRKCTIDGIADKNGARRAFAERQAINAPLQGSAADIIKRAMVAVDRALKAHPALNCRMLLQVHDELVFEVKTTQAQEAATLIKEAMEGAADVGLPLIVEAGIGQNWGAAH